MGNCSQISKQKIFTFEENRSKLTLKNIDEVESEKIIVDGCKIKEGIKCDYMHIAKDIEMYIELKGQDVGHAMEQIKRTIKLLSKDKKQNKRCYISSTKCPISATDAQKYAREFKKDFNAKLIIRSSPHTDTY